MAAVEMDIERYHRQGYLAGFEIYPPDRCAELLKLYWRLRRLLPPGSSTQKMDWWHGQDRPLWEVCTHSRILDLAEAIVGPDFYLWGTQFFSKDPGDGRTAPWHQDAYYWPLSPHKSVTVWLAFTDSDEENGCMRVIPGTHRMGRFAHGPSGSQADVLELAADLASIREECAASICLKAGQASLHDDNILHGSGPNRSERLRCGLTIRFSAGEVRGDTSVWPFFKSYWMRGVDRWRHNPQGTPPPGEMTRYVPVTR